MANRARVMSLATRLWIIVSNDLYIRDKIPRGNDSDFDTGLDEPTINKTEHAQDSGMFVQEDHSMFNNKSLIPKGNNSDFDTGLDRRIAPVATAHGSALRPQTAVGSIPVCAATPAPIDRRRHELKNISRRCKT
jgi:hypothetical protein